MARLEGGEPGPRSWGRAECEAFVDAHYRGVYRFLFWLTGSRDAAEDLTQESFAAFWESLERPGPAPDPKAWLYGIARNRWRKRRRDGRRLDDALSLSRSGCMDEEWEPLDDAPGPEALLLAAEDFEAVRRAVAELPPDYREALVLRVWEEMSYRQAAEALGVSEELARWRVHQARRRLRAALAGDTRREETGASA